MGGIIKATDQYVLERIVDTDEVVIFSHHPILGRLYWRSVTAAGHHHRASGSAAVEFGLTGDIFKALRFPRAWAQDAASARVHRKFQAAIASSVENPDHDDEFGWHGVDQLASQAKWSMKEFHHWMRRGRWEEIAAPLASSYLRALPAHADQVPEWTENIEQALTVGRVEMEQLNAVRSRLVGSASSRFSVRLTTPVSAEHRDEPAAATKGERLPIPKILVPLICCGAAFEHMGGTSDTRGSLGHLQITYAAKRVFRIHRYPTHPERFVSDFGPINALEDVAGTLEGMSEKEWREICAALQEFHQQTVVELRKRYPSGKVTLQRRLKLIDESVDKNAPWHHRRQPDFSTTYAGHLCVAALKARREGGVQQIPFETDIVTGWCLEDPGMVYGSILLRKEFDIEDVLMAAPYSSPAHQLEQDEWLILNRHPAGIMMLNPANVEIPVEVADKLTPVADVMTWNALLHWRWSRGVKRVKAFALPPSHVCQVKEPWFVELAHRLDRYLSTRRLRKMATTTTAANRS